mmetsp:Transcript_87583/g.165081  ORF Transcript_87583/g.165081 Transcript_87583/m.165081 type:complete len:97 (+) Transcript_87583:127-417(+)
MSSSITPRLMPSSPSMTPQQGSVCDDTAADAIAAVDPHHFKIIVLSGRVCTSGRCARRVPRVCKQPEIGDCAGQPRMHQRLLRTDAKLGVRCQQLL